MPGLNGLDWRQIKSHYQHRVRVHSRLLNLLDRSTANEFVALGVGISDGNGNYSASEHHLGPKILESNPGAVR